MGMVNVQVLAEQAVAAGWKRGRLPRAVDREIKAAARTCRFPEWVFQNVAGAQRSYRLRLVLWGVAAAAVVTAVALVLAHLAGPADRWIPSLFSQLGLFWPCTSSGRTGTPTCVPAC